MGFVHSKLRNQLASDKVQKLVSTHQVGIDWGDTVDDEDINEDKYIVDEIFSLMDVDE